MDNQSQKFKKKIGPLVKEEKGLEWMKKDIPQIFPGI